MTIPTLEERVTELESQVADLRALLRKVGEKNGKDWRRTIGAFTDDEGMQSILQEALRLREEDRKKARQERSNRQESQ